MIARCRAQKILQKRFVMQSSWWLTHELCRQCNERSWPDARACNDVTSQDDSQVLGLSSRSSVSVRKRLTWHPYNVCHGPRDPGHPPPHPSFYYHDAVSVVLHRFMLSSCLRVTPEGGACAMRRHCQVSTITATFSKCAIECRQQLKCLCICHELHWARSVEAVQRGPLDHKRMCQGELNSIYVPVHQQTEGKQATRRSSLCICAVACNVLAASITQVMPQVLIVGPVPQVGLHPMAKSLSEYRV